MNCMHSPRSMHRFRRAALVGSFLALTGACRDPFGPDGVMHDAGLGQLSYAREGVVVSVPDSVHAGVPFAVHVRTYGGGCIRQGYVETRVGERMAEVTPVDFFPVRVKQGMACTADLRFHEHVAHITFSRPGIATVRVRGRDGHSNAPVVTDRLVVVR